jgi:predicted house-cleaning noncanonical NTP pyrophosphatase (MazG superfamily)
MTPKKLIRKGTIEKLRPGEFETITDMEELNNLYSLKVIEELLEVRASNFKDVYEFVDLLQVVFRFAQVNGFSREFLVMALAEKTAEKGGFSNIALNNLNPNNPSNAIYLSAVVFNLLNIPR